MLALLGFALVWLLVGIAVGLPLGLWHALVATEVNVRPAVNDGTRRSALSALYTLLAMAFSGTMVCGFIGLAVTAIRIMNGTHERLLDGLAGGLQVGLSIGLIVGVLAALQKGGLFCLRHFAVRALLAMQGSVPWHYARFLDIAAERLLLQKIGGGYLFTHDLLRDYFAKQYNRAAQR